VKYINWLALRLGKLDPPRDRQWLAVAAGVPVVPVPLGTELLRICRLLSLESGSSIHRTIEEAADALGVELVIKGLDGRYLPIGDRT